MTDAFSTGLVEMGLKVRALEQGGAQQAADLQLVLRGLTKLIGEFEVLIGAHNELCARVEVIEKRIEPAKADGIPHVRHAPTASGVKCSCMRCVIQRGGM